MADRQFTVGTILRLVTKPHLQRRGHGARVHIADFEAWLGDELICVSRQPRLDGARELLRRGYLPGTLMTTRANGRDYDSWRPQTLSELAKWTINEESKGGLRRRLWQPFQMPRPHGRSMPGRARRLSGVPRYPNKKRTLYRPIAGRPHNGVVELGEFVPPKSAIRRRNSTPLLWLERL